MEASGEWVEHVRFLVRREVEHRMLAAAWIELIIHEHDLTQARFAEQARQLAAGDARTQRLTHRAAELEARIERLEARTGGQAPPTARAEPPLGGADAIPPAPDRADP